MPERLDERRRVLRSARDTEWTCDDFSRMPRRWQREFGAGAQLCRAGRNAATVTGMTGRAKTQPGENQVWR
jgi:hypothetical protein